MATETLALGPHCGRVTVHVFREGVVSALGHDLVLESTQWEGTAEVDLADPASSRVRVAVPIRSLVVKEAQGGLRKLTAEDEANIAERIAATLRADEQPNLEFRSTAVLIVESPQDIVEDTGPGAGTMKGILALAGREEPLDAEFSFMIQPGTLRLTGRAEVVQTKWGVTPFRGLRFGLKVRDSVEVHFDVLLPIPAVGGSGPARCAPSGAS